MDGVGTQKAGQPRLEGSIPDLRDWSSSLGVVFHIARGHVPSAVHRCRRHVCVVVVWWECGVGGGIWRGEGFKLTLAGDRLFTNFLFDVLNENPKSGRRAASFPPPSPARGWLGLGQGEELTANKS